MKFIPGDTPENSRMILHYEKYNRIGEMLVDALQTDGEHHKQWYLEQVADELGIFLDDIDFEKGIVP